MPKSGGIGRPRGDCLKGAIGSLYYVKGDEYSLSATRCQRGQVDFFFGVWLAPP